MNIHTVETAFTGGMQFKADIGGHEIIMDAGPAEGGNNSGASPKKLMLASIAGCTGIDIVSILNKMKVEFSDLKITVEAELTEHHPKIYNKVNIIYAVKVAEPDKLKMEKAVMLSEEKYCGVAAMFRHFAEIKWKIRYL